MIKISGFKNYKRIKPYYCYRGFWNEHEWDNLLTGGKKNAEHLNRKIIDRYKEFQYKSGKGFKYSDYDWDS